MRRADRQGYFSNLHGKGEKLPDPPRLRATPLLL